MPTYKVTTPDGSYEINSQKELSGDQIKTYLGKSSGPPSTPQSSQPPDTKSALFPRTAQGVDEGRSYPRQVMNAGADLLSLAGRGAASAFDKDRSFKESLADTKGGNLVSRVVRDPGTGAALLTAPISGLAIGGIKGAGMLANAARAGLTGGIEGAASAASHQAENVGSGKKASLADAAAETAISAAIPVGLGAAGKAVGGVLKATGKKILDSAIKPAKKLTQGQGSKFDVQNIFDLGLDSPKGLKAMDEKIADFHSELNNRYGAELASVKDGVFNAGQAFKEAVKKAADRLKKGRVTPEEEKGIQHGIEEWGGYLTNSEFVKGLSQAGNYALPAGSMPADAAVAVRAAVQKAAKYDKIDPKSVKGAELFAQDLQAAMNEQLSQKFPGLRKLDAEFSKLHPVERATEDAVNRTAKNYGISLLDLGGLGVLGLGAGQGNKDTSLSGLALLAATRGARSPGVASALYRGGKGVTSEYGNKATSALAKLAGRGSAQYFRGDQ